MESPNKKGPSVWFNELRGLLTLIFQKVSKLVDRVLFDKKRICDYFFGFIHYDLCCDQL